MAADAAQPKAAAKPRGRGKLIVLVVGVVLTACAGVAGYMFWPRSAGEPAPAHEATAAPSGIVSIEPFLVNLADQQAQRFARVTVRLVVQTEAGAEEIAADPLRQARLRSAVLEILAQQTAGEIVTVEGKSQLKKAIAERGTHVLEQQVHDVLFTDFVVQ
jgi:flagellar FliL protein